MSDKPYLLLKSSEDMHPNELALIHKMNEVIAALRLRDAPDSVRGISNQLVVMTGSWINSEIEEWKNKP